MTPIVVNALGGGFALYLRPTMKAALRQMATTKATVWDPIEREKVAGGVPAPMWRAPITYSTKAAALASLKTPIAA